ncbi:MAG TPA: hypothetical protein VNR67_07470 [Solirubrobacterales bacterium]|nr:hypothetical protein [Solirubrobacterales bacterium]
MRPLRIALPLAVAAALAIAAIASAAYPKPPTGAWTLGPGSGFTLANGKGSQKGKVILANLHAKLGADCSTAPGATVKVPGGYPLKLFRRGGYTAWGVGRNVGGEPTYVNAPVVVGGKTVTGSFYLLWDYQDPSAIFRGGIKVESCTVEFVSGKPK